MILWLILIVLCRGLSSTYGSAKKLNTSEIFPQIYSIDTDVPWVWDAVCDSHNALVSMVTIPSSACRFDRAQWLSLVSMFPQYSNQLADGNTSNILIDYTRKALRSIYSTIVCHYYQHSNWVNSTIGFPVQFNGHSHTSSILVKCPSPAGQLWNKVQLSHSTNAVSFNRSSAFNVYHLKRDAPQYDFTVCTATMNSNRSYLVEWLEYHILQGFEHFYMYDMSVDKTSPDQLLSAVLSDYITQGLVSVVHWPYENCVRGMAKGRTVHYYTAEQVPDVNEGTYFHAPKIIAQYAALSSCYQRFKHTTKYMAHIDDDEFLYIDQCPAQTQAQGRTHAAAAQHTTVRSYASEVFNNHPKAPAIYFLPFKMANIRTFSSHSHTSPTSSLLQRYGVWQPIDLMSPHEGKMIMKTEAVEDFAIHYIYSVYSGYSKGHKFVPPRLNASLLHYKSGYPDSKSIWGQTLPLTRNSSVVHWVNQTLMNSLTKRICVSHVFKNKLESRMKVRLS